MLKMAKLRASGFSAALHKTQSSNQEALALVSQYFFSPLLCFDFSGVGHSRRRNGYQAHQRMERVRWLPTLPVPMSGASSRESDD